MFKMFINKNQHVADFTLLQYIYSNIAKKKSEKIRNHFDKCPKCMQRYQFLLNQVKQKSVQNQRELDNKTIESLYQSFIQTKLNPYKSNKSEAHWTFSLPYRLAFASSLVLIIIGVLFIINALQNTIQIDSFKGNQIVINQKTSNLAKLNQLPQNKLIHTEDELTITIKESVQVHIEPNTKFSVHKEKKYTIALFQGDIEVETLQNKDTEVRVEQFVISPIGTKYIVQNNNQVLKIYLLKGELKIHNQKNEKNIFLSSLTNNLFIYNLKINQEDKNAISKDKQKYYYLGEEYKRLKQWRKSIQFFNKYIIESKNENQDKYNAMYYAGVIYYENLNDKDQAYYYFKKIINSKFSSAFTNTLRRMKTK